MTVDGPGDYIAPENRARARIDDMLTRTGWVVQDYKSVNLYAGEGVAVRELVTAAGPADYVLFVNRQAVGVIEAKKQGTTLAGVECVLGFPLPPSSRRHLPHWYGYDNTAVGRAIRDAGWRARRVNLESETVTFQRQSAGDLADGEEG